METIMEHTARSQACCRTSSSYKYEDEDAGDDKYKDEVPNAVTLAAIEEAERGGGYGPFNSVEEMFEALHRAIL